MVGDVSEVNEVGEVGEVSEVKFIENRRFFTGQDVIPKTFGWCFTKGRLQKLQSLEDTHVGYISQKYTLEKYTLEKINFGGTHFEKIHFGKILKSKC